MEQSVRNKLRNVVTQCRKLLEESVAQTLQGQFGIYATGKKGGVHVDEESRMGHLSDEDQAYRGDLLDHLDHIKARGFKPQDALDQLVREIAFTHLNRLCAYKMMEARGLIRESVSRGVKSQGFLFYLADHPEDEQLYNTGDQETAYRHFLDWLGGTLSEEIGVLFNPNDPANRLYPPQRLLDEVIGLLNGDDIKPDDTELRSQWPGIWSQDETIGWVYQYFTPKELRDAARDPKRGGSAAPRNSYELAFRNQFFTPRYVVEFLTGNTLGRIWYEMRKGDTKLATEGDPAQCRYMVRRPNEIFLDEGQMPPETPESQDDLPQEELLKQPVHIPHRPKKDPRELKILDPACGSGHFLLYCFDLLLTIYEEAYSDPDLGPALHEDYARLDDLRRDVPRLILTHNLHGIDIDLRCTQIAALALWLRCQRAWQEMGLKKDRPKITRSNLVCAEPMPGEEGLLDEFLQTLHEDRLPKLIRSVMDVPDDKPVRATPEMAERLCELVRLVWDRMQLAGEAGSLLKIEEELKEAIRSGQDEWEEQQPLFRFTQYGLASTPQEKYVRFVPGEGVSFWGRAEALVMAALAEFAEYAADGGKFLRNLFADDAMRGFAFVGVCRQRFDVVLMNPPFGESIPSLRKFVSSSYPLSAQDLGMSFVDRGCSLLADNGYVAAITSRTFIANDGMSEWRSSRLLGGSSSLAAFADLGYGVLDEAMVEAAAYVICSSPPKQPVVFLNCLASMLKDFDLRELTVFRGPPQSRSLQDLTIFRQVPNHVLCYWLPPHFLTSILSLSNISDDGSPARVGLQTGDNHRFVRAVWEVAPASIGKSAKWSFFAKGGEYEPYYDDIHLVVLWENDGLEIKSFTDEKGKLLSRPQNLAFYHAEGITYPDRTTSDFSPRIMPTGIVFSSTGFALFPAQKDYLLGYLGAAYTRPFKLLVEAFVGSGDTSVSGSAARHYRPGVLNVLPNLLPHPAPAVCEVIRSCIQSRIKVFQTDETTRYFVSPLAHTSTFRDALSQIAFESRLEVLRDACAVIEVSKELEQEVLRGLNEMHLESIFDELHGRHPADYSSEMTAHEKEWGCELLKLDEISLVAEAKKLLGASRQIIKKSYFAERRLELVSHMLGKSPRAITDAFAEVGDATAVETADVTHRSISYCIGCVVGRWDCEGVAPQKGLCDVPNPFAALPMCAPGTLKGPEGLPATPEDVPDSYPVRIDWDGILVDDVEHQDDIVQRVRGVLEIIWSDRADAIENEACEILGVKTLRDYFRKPGAGGFWADHVSRYSKSRRKAPIYWLLQSSKKNYAVWLYYHRLDKDMLFKALVNYVEPKIRLEENRLDSLRSEKSSGEGTNKKLDKQIEKQEDLLSELHDFEAKLRRAADLRLEPDLNDGVVLNIAPLHELVPWREAKNYWSELLDGKYEWSSIGKQLREKGLVK